MVPWYCIVGMLLTHMRMYFSNTYIQAMADKVASKDAVMIDIPAVMKACKSYMKKIYQADAKKSAESGNKQLQEQIETVDTLREGFDG